MEIERPVLELGGTDCSHILVWSILVWGVLMILNPHLTWAWEWWEFADKPEPSELRLWVTRVVGVLVVGVMVYMLNNAGPLVLGG